MSYTEILSRFEKNGTDILKAYIALRVSETVSCADTDAFECTCAKVYHEVVSEDISVDEAVLKYA